MYALLVLIFACMCTYAAQANVQDHLMPNYLPKSNLCPSGCAQWSTASTNVTEQARLDATWSLGKPPSDASNICAMPAASAGEDLGDGHYNDLVINSFQGPWCYCKDPAPGNKHEQYCYPDPNNLNVPEQINLQLAKQDVVVVSFVTREENGTTISTLPSPVAEWKKVSDTGLATTVLGLSHYYQVLSVAENQNYVLHFIKLGGLAANEKYTYRVKSGSENAPFSDWFTFRAPNVVAGQETRLGFYGDMGHSRYVSLFFLFFLSNSKQQTTKINMFFYLLFFFSSSSSSSLPPPLLFLFHLCHTLFHLVLHFNRIPCII